MFVAFAAIAMMAFFGRTGFQAHVLIVGLMTAGWLLVLGLCCFVDSTYTVAHDDPALNIRRKLWFFKWVRRYTLSEIEAITVRKTWRQGEGLMLQLASGRCKNLTWSLHFQVLDREAAALNHAIHGELLSG